MYRRAAIPTCLALCAALAGGCAGSSSDATFRAALAGAPDSNATAEQPPTAAPKANATPAASKAAQKLTESATPGSLAYKVGPQDVLDVSVFKVPDLSSTIQVSNTGTINLALIGDVQAAGRTPQEIERDVAKRLGDKYLQNPQVRIFVKEYNSQRITVEGAVKKPGVFPYRGGATLLQTIAMAEGLTDLANTDVVVFRTMNGKRAAAKFSLSEIREGKLSDPALQSADVVVVSTDATKEAFQNLLKVIPIANAFAFL